MLRSIALAFLCLAASAAAAPQVQKKSPWSVTLYYGPSTTKFVGATLRSMEPQWSNAMAGLAIDRKLAYLGYDISLAAEAQVTQYMFENTDTTFALGLGFQAENVFGCKRLTFSGYFGPSYGLNPARSSIGYNGTPFPSTRKKFLNYVGAEIAYGIPWDRHWDAVFRFYHRSGVFGLYSDGDDDGLSIGVGLRANF
jgi:hypothetical protein